MTPSLQGRRFGAGSCTWSFHEDREGLVTGVYAGGDVLAGSFVGRRDGSDLSYAWSQLGRDGITASGTADVRLSLVDGAVQVPWGELVLAELPGPRWLRSRVVRSTRSLEAAVSFYGELLGFEVDGPHDELAIVTLPGGAQLELTSGPVVEDLLVLYVPSVAEVSELRRRLVERGVEVLPSQVPYWDLVGVTVLDPDGRQLAVVHPPT